MLSGSGIMRQSGSHGAFKNSVELWQREIEVLASGQASMMIMMRHW